MATTLPTNLSRLKSPTNFNIVFFQSLNETTNEETKLATLPKKLADSQLASRVLDQLEYVDKVCDRFSSSVPGIDRLQRRCHTERRFIQSLLAQDSSSLSCSDNEIERKIEQLRSSNSGQLKAVAEQLELLASSSSTCCGVLEKFPVNGLSTTQRQKSEDEAATWLPAKVEVDLVCHGGSVWLKCVARNPRGLSQTSSGQAGYGSGRGLLQQARLLLRAAALAEPAPGAILLRVHCASGISSALRRRLIDVGVAEVTGPVADGDGFEFDVDDGSDDEDGKSEAGNASYCSAPAVDRPLAGPAAANLDVTCLVALSSNLCRGPGRFQQFLERPLALTAELERRDPCLPPLKLFLNVPGRRLIVCHTAVKEFRSILETVAGPNERRRAEKWLNRVEQVPDQCPAELSNRLRLSRSVHSRHLAIFGTGAALGAVTVTSNAKFVRAAGKQGLHFCVHLHGCRPLTEAKEGRVDCLSSADPTESV